MKTNIETIKLKGHVSFDLYDGDGNLKLHREVDNLVVQGGRELIASQLAEEDIGKPSHMAIGEDDTEPVLSDTTLRSEIARVALTSTERTGNTVVYEATFAPTVGTGEIVEAGIFNADSAGVMLNRAIFGVITKESADTLTITWSLSIL